MDVSKLSAKKIYEIILSAKDPSQVLKESIHCLLTKAIEAPEHFDFLLHRVNWFDFPLNHYSDQLQKIIRFYKGKGRQSAKVGYNLLAEALSIQVVNKSSLKCLKNLFEESYDKKIIIECLKEHYPHKLCPLESHVAYLQSLIDFCKSFQQYRIDFLEILIENLTNFDTEILFGDQELQKPFPEDQKIINLRNSGAVHEQELSQKFNILFYKLLDYLSSLRDDQNILKEIFLVFQNKILPIKSTKMIQFVVFAIAETNKTKANHLISFLLGNIFDQSHKQNWYRIYTQSHFYLTSYISRSKKLSQNSISKVVLILIDNLKQKLADIQSIKIDEKSHLGQIFSKQEQNLFVFQSIIMICQYHPEVKNRLHDEYESIMRLSKDKIHYQYFLKDDILERLQLKKIHNENKNIITLKYSHKFLPMLLLKPSEIIDPMFKFSHVEKDKVIEGYGMMNCKKLIKGETPISFCSDTGL